MDVDLVVLQATVRDRNGRLARAQEKSNLSVLTRSGYISPGVHRDTFFRPPQNIERNDMIALTTTHREYRYRVLSTRIVNPSDTAVLGPGETGGPYPDRVLPVLLSG